MEDQTGHKPNEEILDIIPSFIQKFIYLQNLHNIASYSHHIASHYIALRWLMICTTLTEWPGLLELVFERFIVNTLHYMYIRHMI